MALVRCERLIHSVSRSSINMQTADVPTWKNWIEKSIKKSRKIRGGNYVQISTVEKCNHDGKEVWKPRNRTVVFRGFTNSVSNNDVADSARNDDIGNIGMKMITDSRSNKVDQIETNAHGELVWWFPLSSEQYRFQGEYRLVFPETSKDSHTDRQSLYNNVFATERHNTWHKLSDPAKSQFFWPQPGVEYKGLPSFDKESETNKNSAANDNPVHHNSSDVENLQESLPDNFLLLLFFPTRVHYLRLKDNFASQDLYVDGVWTWQRLNP